MIQNGAEKTSSKHQWEIPVYVLPRKQWKTLDMEGMPLWLFVQTQAASLRILWEVWQGHLLCVPFFITISHYPFWVHSNLSPTFFFFLDPLPLLIFVAGRESMVMPILPAFGHSCHKHMKCQVFIFWGSWDVSLHVRSLYFKAKFVHITLEQTYKRILKLRSLV